MFRIAREDRICIGFGTAMPERQSQQSNHIILLFRSFTRPRFMLLVPFAIVIKVQIAVGPNNPRQSVCKSHAAHCAASHPHTLLLVDAVVDSTFQHGA